MAANNNPIFVKEPQINWGSTDGDGGSAGALKTANTAKDGTGTVLTVFTADATNGSFIQKVRFRPAGTNASTVARIFINNGSTNGTASNNVLFTEITLSATTGSETGALQEYEVPLNIPLPAGYKILVTLGTTVSNGYFVSAIGGKY